MYEKKNGHIEIKGINSLRCQIKKEKNGEWRPTVAVEWLGSYLITPAILLFILTKILSLNGTGPLIASILIGWVIGNVWANQKRKETDELLMELLE